MYMFIPSGKHTSELFLRSFTALSFQSVPVGPKVFTSNFNGRFDVAGTLTDSATGSALVSTFTSEVSPAFAPHPARLPCRLGPQSQCAGQRHILQTGQALFSRIGVFFGLRRGASLQGPSDGRGMHSLPLLRDAFTIYTHAARTELSKYR